MEDGDALNPPAGGQPELHQSQPMEGAPQEPPVHPPTTHAPEFQRMSSLAGHEEVLYGAPQALPDNPNMLVFDYLIASLVALFVVRMIAGAFIMAAYHSSYVLSFQPLIIFLLVAQFGKAAVDVYFWSRHGAQMPELIPTFTFNVIMDLSFAVVYLGIYLTLAKSMAVDALPWFLAVHLFICFVRMCFEPPNALPVVSGGFFALLEAIQLLVIATKLGVDGASVNWTWVLIAYYVVALVFLVIAAFLFLVLLAFTLMWAFSDAFRQIPPFVLLAGATVLFTAVWFLFVFYLIVSGFELLAATNHLGYGTPKGPPSTRMLVAGYILAICGFITTVAILATYAKLKEAMLESMTRGRAKEITLKSFAENFNLNITQVSENFFRPAQPPAGGAGPDLEAGGTPAQARTPLGEDDGLCIICQDKKSDTMCKPCGHGGFCTECMKEYLKDKDECSLCRVKIDEVYLLVEDPSGKGFKARGVIKLKR